MLDAAKSSTNPQHTPALSTPAPTATLEEGDPRPRPQALPETVKAEEPRYSIRIAKTPGTCAVCRKHDTGIGPVGYSGEEPICDLCLLGESTDLGMILALIAVVRAYGSIKSGEPDALNELGFFARLFHQIASKSSPVRVFRIPGLTRGEQVNHRTGDTENGPNGEGS